MGFHEDSSTVRIDLGPNAAADLESQLFPGGGGWFSVGLRVLDESGNSMMEIRDLQNQLRVYYDSQ